MTCSMPFGQLQLQDRSQNSQDSCPNKVPHPWRRVQGPLAHPHHHTMRHPSAFWLYASQSGSVRFLDSHQGQVFPSQLEPRMVQLAAPRRVCSKDLPAASDTICESKCHASPSRHCLPLRSRHHWRQGDQYSPSRNLHRRCPTPHRGHLPLLNLHSPWRRIAALTLPEVATYTSWAQWIQVAKCKRPGGNTIDIGWAWKVDCLNSLRMHRVKIQINSLRTCWSGVSHPQSKISLRCILEPDLVKGLCLPCGSHCCRSKGSILSQKYGFTQVGQAWAGKHTRQIKRFESLKGGTSLLEVFFSSCPFHIFSNSATTELHEIIQQNDLPTDE